LHIHITKAIFFPPYTFSVVLVLYSDLTGVWLICSVFDLQEVLTQVLKEAGYTKDSYLTLDDFIKVCTFCYVFPPYIG